VVSAGYFETDRSADWGIEQKTIELNVLVARASSTPLPTFPGPGGGAFGGLTSIGGVRGNGVCPAYNASKAFLSNYLEGLRQSAYLAGAAISVTDIVPGYIRARAPRSGRKGRP